MTASTTKSTSTTKSPARRAAPRRPDALRLLMQDHQDVKALFKAYDKLAKAEADASHRKSAAEQICTLLSAHATVEEELFYPAARSVLEQDDLIDEAEVEHASAKDLIAQIRGMSPSDDLFDAKVKVLGEYIDHHVKEEEKQIFPKVRKGELDLKSLGESLAARKQELLAEASREAGSTQARH
ncbi:MAG TPA: hemerythrin domain-containing protein [Rhizobacter sp.]|nr:hemerythrin domain-containing protein [Rhizobacter sp.]